MLTQTLALHTEYKPLLSAFHMKNIISWHSSQTVFVLSPFLKQTKGMKPQYCRNTNWSINMLKLNNCKLETFTARNSSGKIIGGTKLPQGFLFGDFLPFTQSDCIQYGH